MRKRIFSSLLLAAASCFVVSSVFVSCKDYDDDISELRGLIDENSKAIEEINALISSGSVITDVTSSDNGVTVTLSNDKSFTITNGKDGVPGTTWTIGTDGFWYKDSEKTDYYALGKDGADGKDGVDGTNGSDGKDGVDGTNGTNGKDGIYYVPNPTTGCFDIYNGDGTFKETTSISYLGTATTSITAVKDGENLTLYGVQGTSAPVVISLSGNLRSLVFIPELYLDGIETIEYPWLYIENYMKQTTGGTGTNHQNKTVKNLEDYDVVTTLGPCVYGPAWAVDYHMNPSNANVKSEDVSGFNVLNPTVIYTRADAKDLGIKYAEKNAADQTIFANKDGILTVGLQVERPDLLESQPTTGVGTKTDDNTIALQVRPSDATNDEVITSDYALLRPTKVTLEGLVWVEKPMYGTVKEADRTETGDKDCSWAITPKKVHVWDTPQEALADTRGAALELYYNSEEGINISKYLGIHYSKENVDPTVTTPIEGTWKFGQEKEWGLSYEFNLVYYTVDGNATVDSKYANWVEKNSAGEAFDGKSVGQLRAWNVKYDADRYPEDGATSASTIDREPLVQVLIKDNEGHVVLDGYILIHITREAPEEAANKTIDKWTAQSSTFDLCNASDVFKTTWAEFSDYVLTQEMENMTKEDFDAQYEIDYDATVTPTTGVDGTVYSLNIYESAEEKGGSTQVPAPLGTVEYIENTQGTTNHTFKWTISETELEELTHDAASLPVEVVRYVRYKAIAGSGAKYPYIYIKLTAKIGRNDLVANTFGSKINEYWFGLDGKDAGWDAIVFDFKEPRNDQYIETPTLNRTVRSTLDGNQETTTGEHKYYFIPKNVTITDEATGDVYTITAASSATDTRYNSLNCLYTTDRHTYDIDKLDEILNGCAIKYGNIKQTEGVTPTNDGGAFDNDNLYAVINGAYTKIATLYQKTGEIELENNAASKKVLNAVGYAANHANIDSELRTWVGVVAKGGNCNYATKVSDFKFLTSWQRPINMKDIEDKVAVDANTNGNLIYLMDHIKLFDWRGETDGYMWGDQQWFWAYYGVKAISVDVSSSKILTNMNQSSTSTFVPLSDVTSQCEFYWVYDSATKGQGQKSFTFTNLSSYNSASKNDALLQKIADRVGNFGAAIQYYNNGDNVTEFTVKIPVGIEYEWGEFTTYLTLTIQRTTGH